MVDFSIGHSNSLVVPFRAITHHQFRYPLHFSRRVYAESFSICNDHMYMFTMLNAPHQVYRINPLK